MILYNIPCSMFITPSKTATEVLLHMVFPALYVHISGRVFSGYAHGYAFIDASYAESYYQTDETFVGRQAHNVVQVS